MFQLTILKANVLNKNRCSSKILRWVESVVYKSQASYNWDYIYYIKNEIKGIRYIHTYICLKIGLTCSTVKMEQMLCFIDSRTEESFVSTWMLCSVSISDKTSYRTISQSLEIAIYVFIMVGSIWNSTGTSAAVLPVCLSNFKAMRWTRNLAASGRHESLR